jgi:hypothetical protein
LYLPAESGIAFSIAMRNPRRSRPARSSCVNCVRTAIMPQPMSTPTAAGMIARSVGMTDPTVAPLPRCASGINARCGKTNGMDAARAACASVAGSSTDAQLIRRSRSCVRTLSFLSVDQRLIGS